MKNFFELFHLAKHVLISGLRIILRIFWDFNDSQNSNLNISTDDPSLDWGNTQDDGWID